MARVKFISTEYLKNNSAINGNVDDDILNPYIYKAQETHIQQALGSTLYTKLKNDIINNSITGIYKTILDDYVQPSLLEWSTYESLPFIYMKLTNKSVSKRDSEFSTPAELGELKYLRDAVRDVAEFQTQRLIKYLKENISSIPEYQNPGSGLDVLRPNGNGYFGGIYLGSSDCDFE